MPQSSTDAEKDVKFAEGADVVANNLASPVDSEFPEGGWAGWASVVGAALVQFATFGYITAFGVYQDFYVRQYLSNYTPSEIGWIGSIQIFFVFCCGIITGRAFDRGYFYHLMFGGALLHTFSYFMLSLSSQNQYYQVFLSHGLGGGLAAGITYIPSLTIPTHYFKRHRPVAMGIVSAGAAVGAIVHPIMLNRMFYGSIGFHNGVRISTTLNAFVFLVANGLMRTRLPPKKVAGSYLPVVVGFIGDLPYLFVLIAGVLIFFGIFFPQFFLQLDAIAHGVDPQLGYYLLSILNAGSFFGRIIPPLLAPRLGAFNLLVCTTFASSITLYCLGTIKNEGSFATFAIFYGFFSGAGIALTPSIITSLANDAGEIGARVGIRFAAGGVIGLFATPLLGAFLTNKFLWWRAILFGASTMTGGGFFYVAARQIVARRKGSQLV